jgi:hypothetical protein
VDDALQDVGVASIRHGVEEVSFDDLAAARYGRGLEGLTSRFEPGGCVEEDAMKPGGCFEDRGDQRAVAATNVDDRAEPGEVVASDDVDGGGRVRSAIAWLKVAEARVGCECRRLMAVVLRIPLR